MEGDAAAAATAVVSQTATFSWIRGKLREIEVMLLIMIKTLKQNQKFGDFPSEWIQNYSFEVRTAFGNLQSDRPPEGGVAAVMKEKKASIQVQ